MTQYSAGDAQARFLLDLTPLETAARRAGQILTDLEAKAGKVVLGGSPSDAKAIAAAASLARAQAAQTRAAAAQAAAQAKLQQAQDKSAISAAKLAAEEAKAAKALADQAAAAARAEQAQLRLSQARRRSNARGLGENNGLPVLPRTIAGLSGAASSFAGAAGLSFGAGAALNAGIDAGKRALELQSTIRLTKELAGSQSEYNTVIAAAKRQQELYGGSLQENIAGIQGLVVSARSSGAELSSLIDLSQRLAVLDPAQGAEGARIALSEVLAGDPASLARRYEIPRSALEKIKDTSRSTSERLAILDQYLNKIGITSAVAGQTITEQAQAFNRLNAEIDTLTTNVGGALADALDESATGLGRLIGLINNNPEALAQLRAVLSGRSSIDQGDIAQATQDIQRNQARDSLGLGGTFLTANPRRQRLGERIGDAQGGIVRNMQTGALEDSKAITELVDRTAKLIAVGPEAAAAVGALNEQLRIGTVETPAYYSQLTTLEQVYGTAGGAASVMEDRLERQRRAAEAATVATAGLTEEERKSVLSKTDAAAESRRLGEAQTYIASIGGQVANGIISIADAATMLATRYGFAADEAARLAGEAARAASAAKADVALADQRAGERGGGTAAGERRTAEALRIQQEQARAVEQARARQRESLAGATELVAIREEEYTAAVKRYGVGSAEAIDAETRLLEARQRAERGNEKAGKAADKAATQQATLYDRLEDRTEDYYIKLLKLQEDYQDKSRQSEEDYQLGRARGREDFERQRQRLLAEGKIKEAQLLTEEFNLQRQRDAEDQARKRQREANDLAQQQGRLAADLGLDTGRITDRAALRGVQAPGAPTVAGAPALSGSVPPGAVPAIPVAATGSGAMLRIEFAPIALSVDGQVVASATYPYIEERLDDALAAGVIAVGLVAPPSGGQSGGVGGPRP